MLRQPVSASPVTWQLASCFRSPLPPIDLHEITTAQWVVGVSSSYRTRPSKCRKLKSSKMQLHIGCRYFVWRRKPSVFLFEFVIAGLIPEQRFASHVFAPFRIFLGRYRWKDRRDFSFEHSRVFLWTQWLAVSVAFGPARADRHWGYHRSVHQLCQVTPPTATVLPSLCTIWRLSGKAPRYKHFSSRMFSFFSERNLDVVLDFSGFTS